MKKLFLPLLLLILPAFSFAQTPGVATDIRFGSSLPSGAPLNSVFILTGGSQPFIYICNNSPSCTSAGQWINTQTVCLVNSDGGCAISGTPSIDFWLGTVGSGTLLTKWVSNGTTFYFPVTIQNGSNSGVINLGCASDPGVGTSGIGLVGSTTSCTAYNIYFPPSALNGFLYGSVSGKEEILQWQSGIDLTSQVVNTLPVANGGTGGSTAGLALINLFPATTQKGTIPYWDGTQWNILLGNNNGGLSGFLTANSQGAPNWSALPVPVSQGGTGLQTMSAGAIYKGNTTSSPVPSAVSDNGTTVTIAAEPLSLTTTTVPGCSGCGFPVPYVNTSIITANANTTSNQLLGQTSFTAAQLNRSGASFLITASFLVTPSGSNNQQLFWSISNPAGNNTISIWAASSNATVATVYASLLCYVTATGTSGALQCSTVNKQFNVGTGAIGNTNFTINLAQINYISAYIAFSTGSTSNTASEYALLVQMLD